MKKGIDDENILRKYKMEIVKYICSNFSYDYKQCLYAPDIIKSMQNIFNLKYPEPSLKSQVYSTLKLFKSLGGLTRDVTHHPHKWERTINFYICEKQVKDIFKKQKIIKPKVVNDESNKLTIKDMILLMIYKYPERSFTVNSIFLWSGYDERIHKPTCKDYIYRSLIYDKYITRDNSNTGDGREKIFTKTIILDKYVEDHLLDDNDLKTLENTDVEKSVRLAFNNLDDSDKSDHIEISELNSLPLEDKLDILSLSSDEIGLVIVNLLNNLKSSKTEMEEELKASYNDSKQMLELQGDVNILKIENGKLKKEIKNSNLRESHSNVLRQSVENLENEKLELNKKLKTINIKLIEKENQSKFHVGKLKELLNRSKEEVDELKKRLESKKSKKKDIKLGDFSELGEHKSFFKKS